MEFDFAKAYDCVVQAVETLDIGQAMNTVIDCCEELAPHPDWARLRLLPYAEEAGVKAHVVHAAMVAEPPGEEPRGLWLGINNPVIEGEPVADIYVAGAPKYDRNDPDWLLEADYYPESGRFHSGVMAEIYRIAYSDSERGLGNPAEYTLCLAYGALLARTAVQRMRDVKPGPMVGVAVGFDSGDFIDLGYM